MLLVPSLAISIALISNFVFTAVLTLFLLSPFLVAKKGIEINFRRNEIRKTFNLFGARSGKWLTLPKVEYISVFRSNKSQTLSSRGTTGTVKYTEILVNLIHSKSQKITVFSSKKEDECFKIAKKLAVELDVKIFDATSRDPKWL